MNYICSVIADGCYEQNFNLITAHCTLLSYSETRPYARNWLTCISADAAACSVWDVVTINPHISGDEQNQWAYHPKALATTSNPSC